MNATIHPRYAEATITCTTCGAVHATRSTRADYAVDVCSECHPFYTGVARTVDRGGRVARFERRAGLAARGA